MTSDESWAYHQRRRVRSAVTASKVRAEYPPLLGRSGIVSRIGPAATINLPLIASSYPIGDTSRTPCPQQVPRFAGVDRRVRGRRERGTAPYMAWAVAVADSLVRPADTSQMWAGGLSAA